MVKVLVQVRTSAFIVIECEERVAGFAPSGVQPIVHITYDYYTINCEIHEQ